MIYYYDLLGSFIAYDYADYRNLRFITTYCGLSRFILFLFFAKGETDARTPFMCGR